MTVSWPALGFNGAFLLAMWTNHCSQQGARVCNHTITLTFHVIRRCIIDKARAKQWRSSLRRRTRPFLQMRRWLAAGLNEAVMPIIYCIFESTLHSSSDFAYQLSTPPYPPLSGSFYKGYVNYRRLQTCHNMYLCFVMLSCRGCKICLKYPLLNRFTIFHGIAFLQA